MKTPEQIAAEIVGQFQWHSNVVVGGCLVGQQHVVAQAIAHAIQDERARTRIARDALIDVTHALAGVTSGHLKPKGRIAPRAFDRANAALGLTA